MSVLNINRNTSNPENNTVSPYVSAPTTMFVDWRIVVFGSIIACVLWIIALVIAQWQCSANYITPCYYFHIVFWLPLIGLTIFFSFLGAAIVEMYRNRARRERLANLLYEHYDVDNASSMSEHAATIAMQIARSEHMRGLDTLTVTGSTGNSGGKQEDRNNLNPLQDNPIILEEIFKHKED